VLEHREVIDKNSSHLRKMPVIRLLDVSCSGEDPIAGYFRHVSYRVT